MGQRRGQLSLFILLGMLVLLAILFVARKEPQELIQPAETTDYTEVTHFVQQCLDDSAQMAVDFFSQSGDPLSEEILMIGDGSRAVFLQSTDVPSTEDALESIKEAYLYNIEECAPIDEFPYEIASGIPSAELYYGSGTIQFKTRFPLTINTGGQIEEKTGMFQSQVSYPLDAYLFSARQAVNALTINPPYVNVSALNRLEPRYSLMRMQDPHTGVLLSLDEEESPTSYAFIVRTKK